MSPRATTGSLFESDAPQPEETRDVPLSQLRAQVVIAEPLGPLDYAIPKSLEEAIVPGVPVRVPLGKRTTRGYVTSLSDKSPDEGITLKPLKSIDADRPKLPPVLVDLFMFASRYYRVSPNEVFQAALPADARVSSTKYKITEEGRTSLAGKLTDGDRTLLELATRFPKGFTVAACERDLAWSRRSASTRLRKLVDRALLEKLGSNKGPRHAAAFRRVGNGEASRIHPKTRALYDQIPTDGSILASTLAATDKSAYSKLKTLEKVGLVERVSQIIRLNPHTARLSDAEPPTPTPAQAAAISQLCDSVDRGTFSATLLEGVTGSGKTEVYLRVIQHALAAGKTALVLVPEIALTPQLGRRFRERFGGSVATFHSGLTNAERRDEWERIASGKAKIGLGARSALFLPLKDVGVIIVDEEHETSFKQEETPRYHARDLAVVRARMENATVILGSATPSLESKFNVTQERYHWLELGARVTDRPMPPVRRIDMKNESRVGEGILTVPLANAIDETLSRGEQIVLFLNRRGFASYVSCGDCGYAFRCENCDVALTLHRRRDVLACHYCGHEERISELCPSCHGLKLDSGGLGTERVELEIENLFPGTAVARLDRDTIRRRADLEKVLQRFGDGEAQILVGTQMVAKGHDFPNVTLVGVLNADAGLNFPDFRAAERTFQLLTQVSGRSGRGEKAGRVVVQTYDPEHYAVARASAHDYSGFFEEELEWRRELGYPPFAHLALLRFESAGESRALRIASTVAENLRAVQGDVELLGPAPCAIARVKGLWRFQVLVKAPNRPELHRVLANFERVSDPHTRQILDVDPISML